MVLGLGSQFCQLAGVELGTGLLAQMHDADRQ
jgi:hypothetical protein